MFYSVVMLDGKELHCLTFEEVQELFFNRRLNQESLICSAEDGQWKMLRRTFDLSQWLSNAVPPTPTAPNNFQAVNNPFQQSNQPNAFEPPENQFEQSPAQNQFVTFNQFPPNPPNNPYAQNTSNGYSQNNQTETYYQAETSQTNYNFQKTDTSFAPSRYNNPPNSYNYAPNFTNNAERRGGLRAAGIFLTINVFIYIEYAIYGEFFKESGAENGASKIGEVLGTLSIPLLIDTIFIIKLLKLNNPDSARIWGLVRTYWSVIFFGILVPLGALQMNNLIISLFSIVSAFFFCISLMIVLHGKENPPQSRVMIGVGTFAIYFLIMFGTLALSAVGKFAPNVAKLDVQNTEFDKYKVEGKQFEDKTTGAKVVLPEGWTMLTLDNPHIHTPEARMIAVDKPGNRVTLLEVVPVPGNLDMKRQNSTFILDRLADGVVETLRQEVLKQGGFGNRNAFNEITRLNIYVGTHPAKLLVFDKTVDGFRAKGHLIITYDELTFYVLHSWCPAEEYEQAQNEFTFFEKNFSVPDKINSAFTQSAETQKNNANTEKKF
jgi:hypothetical protein